jgi:hypothetical protein
MMQMLELVRSKSLSRDEARAARRAKIDGKEIAGKEQSYVFSYIDPEKSYKVEVRFKTQITDESAVRAALRTALSKLDGHELQSITESDNV